MVKENWEHHREIKINALTSLDNIIFVVNTGAIGISVGTIGYFNGDISHFQTYTLIASWALLFLSILSSVVSHIFNAHSSRLNMDILEHFVLSGYTDPSPLWNMDTSDNLKIKRAGIICGSARSLSLVFLIVGTLMLFVFGGSLLLAKSSHSPYSSNITKPM